MLAGMLHGRWDLSVEEIETPKPRPGSVRLQATGAGRAFGASLIAISEPSEARGTAALKIAADQDCVSASRSLFADAEAISEGPFEIVFEASGTAAAFEQGFAALHRGGVLPEAIRLAAAGRINLEPLIIAVFPVSEFPSAMSATCESENLLKVDVTIGRI